ncbi:MAG: dienelactone hydrolase family protein [Verrucomicrobiota bacterium]
MNWTFVFAASLLLHGGLLAQDWAKARLEKSPRHLEWVDVKNGDRKVACFIAFPEKKEKATTVVVIHEIFGLTDWVRGVADQLAEAGYIAIAPDLLSGLGTEGKGTAGFTGNDTARKAVSSLPPDQVVSDLDAAVGYVAGLPASNGKVAVAGFCWGGSQTFRFATRSNRIKAAFPFYGAGPTLPEDIRRITAPVYGFYGENDERVNSTIPVTEELMKAADKSYTPAIYAGAGHGFMRVGEAPDANATQRSAREKAWKRWLELLGKL